MRAFTTLVTLSRSVTKTVSLVSLRRISSGAGRLPTTSFRPPAAADPLRVWGYTYHNHHLEVAEPAPLSEDAAFGFAADNTLAPSPRAGVHRSPAEMMWYLPDQQCEVDGLVDTSMVTMGVTPTGQPNIKGNPTESEADVQADRDVEDPLPMGMHHTIPLPEGEAAPKRTESEEDVRADRSDEDPLLPGMKIKK